MDKLRSAAGGGKGITTTPITGPASGTTPVVEKAPGIIAKKPRGYIQGGGSRTDAKKLPGISAVSVRLQGQPEQDGFRFSKHSGPEIQFPLTPAQAAKLQNCDAVSPFVVSDPRVHISPDFLPKPTHPSDAAFWPEFEAVIDLQVARKAQGMARDILNPPKIFANSTMEEAAQAVRADFPTQFPTELVQQFLAEGAKVDPAIVKPKTQAEFVDGPVLLARLIGWAVSEVSPSAFACKWSEGRARPESVAWAVHNGELDAPAEIKAKVAALNLQSPEDFTAYDEGCPRHPSWPAMHSAASSSSLYLAVVMDLSPEQIAEARKLDYAVATFRSVAGVHYDSDNRAGLALGQEVIAKQLPEVLARFGADPAAVRAKIERVRHDWFEYEANS